MRVNNDKMDVSVCRVFPVFRLRNRLGGETSGRTASPERLLVLSICLYLVICVYNHSYLYNLLYLHVVYNMSSYETLYMFSRARNCLIAAGHAVLCRLDRQLQIMRFGPKDWPLQLHFHSGFKSAGMSPNKAVFLGEILFPKETKRTRRISEKPEMVL